MSQGHDHDQQPGQMTVPADLREMFTKQYWDERYAASDRVWSGRPNQRLAEELADLTPGTALDIGCGEGADAVWLAARGWSVTGVDVSDVALSKAAGHAGEAGVGERTSWLQADVYALEPLPSGVDLVTASFVHVPPADFDAVYRHLAACVAPGGSLFVLGHHPDDAHTGLRNSGLSALLFTPAAVVATLDPDAWDVVTEQVLSRQQVHDGVSHAVSDTVVRAVRRA